MASNRFDRADHLRSDAAAQAEGWSSAYAIRIDPAKGIVIENGAIALDPATSLASSPPDEAIFLGTWEGTHVWAVREVGVRPSEQAFRLLRLVGAGLDPDSKSLLFTALALMNWHDSAAFSGHDGSPTKLAKGGWTRIDEGGREDFPRTDAAVICLIHDGADRVLLARRAGVPGPRFALLAGFVEAGESAEECVEREMREEVGLDVSDIKYFGSQPWPFPRSLMLGFTAVADPEQSLEYRDGEIDLAQWFTRDQVRDALRRGDWTSKETDVPLMLPGGLSIARRIIENWSSDLQASARQRRASGSSQCGRRGT
jgi:NAD+ diphosphatase